MIAKVKRSGKGNVNKAVYRLMMMAAFSAYLPGRGYSKRQVK